MPHDVRITMTVDLNGLTQANIGSQIVHSVQGAGAGLSHDPNHPNDSQQDSITVPKSKTLVWRFKEKHGGQMRCTQVGIIWKTPPPPPANPGPFLVEDAQDTDDSTKRQLETKTGNTTGTTMGTFPYELTFTLNGTQYTFDPKIIVSGPSPE